MKNRGSSLYVVVSVTVVVTLLVVILSAFAGGMILAPYFSGDAEAASPAQPAPAIEQAAPALQAAGDADLVAAYEQALIDIYQATLPSAVSLRVTKKFNHAGLLEQFNIPNPDNSKEGPSIPEELLQGQGSGFVWDNEGHILTNYHVVVDATDVEVVFADGRIAKAEVLGTAPDVDLAVVKVDLPPDQLQPITIGNSDDLQVGQLAIAIGSPFGQEFTMTNGIVSAVGRTIRSGNTPFSIPQVIQTDASINPGNSGGPLLNRQGEVIGINSQIATRSGANSGVGFAIPINIAKQVVPTLIQGETYNYAWLGITGRTVTTELVDLLNLPADTQGVLVLDVAKDSPAAISGLQAGLQTAEEPGGDIITAINGEPVTGMDTLIAYLTAETRPGDQVELTLLRDGQPETVTVTLAARPAELAIETGQNKGN